MSQTISSKFPADSDENGPRRKIANYHLDSLIFLCRSCKSISIKSRNQWNLLKPGRNGEKKKKKKVEMQGRKGKLGHPDFSVFDSRKRGKKDLHRVVSNTSTMLERNKHHGGVTVQLLLWRVT